jgi:hypothetical protein
LDDADDPPPFQFGQRARFHDFHQVTDPTFVAFVVGVKLAGAADDLFVKRMAHQPIYGDDDGFVHLVADDPSDENLPFAPLSAHASSPQ